MAACATRETAAAPASTPTAAPPLRESVPGREEAARNDLELARRCTAGDPIAHRLFFDRYARLVLSVCRRKGLTPEAAEDVAQETFAAAFRALAAYRGEARLSSWLFTLACRRVASHRRRSTRGAVLAPERVSEASWREPSDAGWERRWIESDRAARVRRAVEELDEPARSVLLGFYVAEISVREIAEALRLPEGTVKSHLHRGRLAVRRKLETS